MPSNELPNEQSRTWVGDGPTLNHLRELTQQLAAAQAKLAEVALPDSEGWWWEWNFGPSGHNWVARDVELKNLTGYSWWNNCEWRPCQPGRWVKAVPPASPTPAGEVRYEILKAAKDFLESTPAPPTQASVSGERELPENCQGEDCSKCSGEYCEQHFDKPCNCDVVERHTIPELSTLRAENERLTREMDAMADGDDWVDATGRLQAWVRDYGAEKQAVFVRDMTAVLTKLAALAATKGTP